MTQPSITKIAFARGVAQKLQVEGRTQFKDLGAVKEASYIIAQDMREEPAEQGGRVSPDELFKVASAWVDYNNHLKPRGKTASYQSELVFFQDTDSAVGDMVTKVAAATATGTQVGNHGYSNNIANAAPLTNAGKIDQDQRPDGYAHVGVGNANFSEPSNARVGMEMPHPHQDHHAGRTGNSVTHASKSAAANPLSIQLEKLAMGTGETPVGAGHPANNIANAAEITNMGKIDQERRPDGYAHVGVGNANFGEHAAARVGDEVPHNHQDHHTGRASNSVTDASKSAADQAYLVELEKVAQHIDHTLVSQYAVRINDVGTLTKVAQEAMGCPPAQRPEFIRQIANEIAAVSR